MPGIVDQTLKLPRFNGWMLPDDALDIIGDLICSHGPALTLECGSGRSTIVLANVLAELDPGMQLVSLEHLPEFDLSTSRLLAENLLDHVAEVRYAPIVDGWYDPAAWADLTDIDMLIVDGPPGHLSHLAREPALPLLLNRLSQGAVVVLDDTNREQEREIVVRWGELMRGSHLHSIGHSTGALCYWILP